MTFKRKDKYDDVVKQQFTKHQICNSNKRYPIHTVSGVYLNHFFLDKHPFDDDTIYSNCYVLFRWLGKDAAVRTIEERREYLQNLRKITNPAEQIECSREERRRLRAQ